MKYKPTSALKSANAAAWHISEMALDWTAREMMPSTVLSKRLACQPGIAGCGAQRNVAPTNSWSEEAGRTNAHGRVVSGCRPWLEFEVVDKGAADDGVANDTRDEPPVRVGTGARLA